MAKLYVTEYAEMAQVQTSKERIAAPQEPALVEQSPITISGTSAQSAAFGSTTRFVRLHTDAICSIKFATDPTATADHKRFAANSTEYFGVVPGGKLAVISNT